MACGRAAAHALRECNVVALAGIVGQRYPFAGGCRPIGWPIEKGIAMAIIEFAKQTMRSLALTGAIAAAVSLVATPNPAEARVDTGTAVGIGVGSFALGTALGAAAANPYANPYYGYGYAAPAPAYYPPAPAYYPPARSCWDPYYRRYYAC